MYVTFPGLETWGRLGNQLFQIAGVLGVAHERGLSPRIKPDWMYKELFSLPSEMYQSVEVTAEVCNCYGYMQNIKIFEPVELQVRQYFQPSNEADERIAKLYGHLGDVSNCVSVHVRRGDYTELQHLFYYLQQTYYLDALRQLRDKVQIDRVLVFSDEPEVASRELSQIDKVVVVPREYDSLADALTLLFMSRCRYHVIANSTFSWWAAWLSGSRHVLYPSQWGAGGYEFNDRLNTIIPDFWEKVDVPESI